MRVDLKILNIILIIYKKLKVIPFFPNNVCRFEPSCSKYFVSSIEENGWVSGSFLGIKRILRCNPYSEGGYDPVLNLKESKNKNGR